MLPDILTTSFLVHDPAPGGVWTLDRPALELLFQRVAPGARTLETGAGMSTVLFALKRARHTCVVPSATEVARIRYTASMLRIGGLLVLDDTQLWPVRLMCDVLLREPAWRLDRELPKTAVFVKLAEHSESKEWTDQRHVIEQTDAMARLARYRRQRDTAIGLLRHGRLIAFGRALGRTLADAVTARRSRVRAS